MARVGGEEGNAPQCESRGGTLAGGERKVGCLGGRMEMEAVVSGVFGFGWVMCLICGEVGDLQKKTKEREMVAICES